MQNLSKQCGPGKTGDIRSAAKVCNAVKSRDDAERRLLSGQLSELLSGNNIIFRDIMVLLEQGADTESRGGAQKLTSLMYFGRGGCYEYARRTVGLGANVNARCESGQTVLMHTAKYASSEGHLLVLALLLENGADKDAEWGSHRVTARGLAFKYANYDASLFLDVWPAFEKRMRRAADKGKELGFLMGAVRNIGYLGKLPDNETLEYMIGDSVTNSQVIENINSITNL